ncbi:MAG: hypothetical protein MJ250_08575 [Alphaproteobacteria bacterium]|nr:hypothetical protein [Alphaproteobacteria bacterium]
MEENEEQIIVPEMHLTAPENIDLTEFMSLMNEHQISESVAQKLLDAHLSEFNKFEQELERQADKNRQDTETALKKEWGTDFDTRLKNADACLKRLSGDDYDYFINQYGNDAFFIRFLDKLSSSLSEGSLETTEGMNKISPAEELSKILSDPNDVFWAGAKNYRNNFKWCEEHNQPFVTEQERLDRVKYVQELIGES